MALRHSFVANYRAKIEAPSHHSTNKTGPYKDITGLPYGWI